MACPRRVEVRQCSQMQSRGETESPSAVTSQRRTERGSARMLTPALVLLLSLACALFRLPLAAATWDHSGPLVNDNYSDFSWSSWETALGIALVAVLLPLYSVTSVVVYRRRSRFPLSGLHPPWLIANNVVISVTLLVRVAVWVSWTREGAPCGLEFVVLQVLLLPFCLNILVRGWHLMFKNEITSHLNAVSQKLELDAAERAVRGEEGRIAADKLSALRRAAAGEGSVKSLSLSTKARMNAALSLTAGAKSAGIGLQRLRTNSIPSAHAIASPSNVVRERAGSLFAGGGAGAGHRVNISIGSGAAISGAALPPSPMNKTRPRTSSIVAVSTSTSSPRLSAARSSASGSVVPLHVLGAGVGGVGSSSRALQSSPVAGPVASTDQPPATLLQAWTLPAPAHSPKHSARANPVSPAPAPAAPVASSSSSKHGTPRASIFAILSGGKTLAVEGGATSAEPPAHAFAPSSGDEVTPIEGGSPLSPLPAAVAAIGSSGDSTAITVAPEGDDGAASDPSAADADDGVGEGEADLSILYEGFAGWFVAHRNMVSPRFLALMYSKLCVGGALVIMALSLSDPDVSLAGGDRTQTQIAHNLWNAPACTVMSVKQWVARGMLSMACPLIIFMWYRIQLKPADSFGLSGFMGLSGLLGFLSMTGYSLSLAFAPKMCSLVVILTQLSLFVLSDLKPVIQSFTMARARRRAVALAYAATGVQEGEHSDRVAAHLKQFYRIGTVLRHPQALPVFHDFTRKEFSSENVAFWIEVRYFVHAVVEVEAACPDWPRLGDDLPGGGGAQSQWAGGSGGGEDSDDSNSDHDDGGAFENEGSVLGSTLGSTLTRNKSRYGRPNRTRSSHVDPSAEAGVLQLASSTPAAVVVASPAPAARPAVASTAHLNALRVAQLRAQAAEVKSWALKIHAQFMVQGAPFEVNIPSDVAHDIERQVKLVEAWQPLSSKEGCLPAPPTVALSSLYRAAHLEIFSLMQRDSFRRFLACESFQCMLQELQADFEAHEAAKLALVEQHGMASSAEQHALLDSLEKGVAASVRSSSKHEPGSKSGERVKAGTPKASTLKLDTSKSIVGAVTVPAAPAPAIIVVDPPSRRPSVTASTVVAPSFVLTSPTLDPVARLSIDDGLTLPLHLTSHSETSSERQQMTHLPASVEEGHESLPGSPDATPR